MNQLDQYLQADYKQDKLEVYEIEKQLDEIFELFLNTYDISALVDNEHKPQWPYVLRSIPKKQKNYSSSTTSMILYALNGYIQFKSQDISVKNACKIEMMAEKITEKMFSDTPSIEDIVTEEGKTISIRKFIIWPENFPEMSNVLLSTSATYGLNDPLTLFWKTSIAKGRDSVSATTFLENLERLFPNDDNGESTGKGFGGQNSYPKITETVGQKIEINNADILDYQDKLVLHDNAFVYLVALRLDAICEGFLSKQKNTTIFDFLENKLHKHLSFYNIPDSRFDPGEMIFSLEGMLLLNKQRVSEGLKKRVFEILQQAQLVTSAFWKPVTPIYAKNTGHILLPLGIEVLNSLLRICKELDEPGKEYSYFSQNVILFKRYIKWLNAQMVSVNYDDKDFIGWNSEHVAKDGEIHLWQTSQIFHFLFEFNQLLKNHIARTALVNSGLKIKRGHVGTLLQYRKECWEKVVDGEPIRGSWGVGEAKVFKIVYDLYIIPRMETPEKEKKDCSFLLYGPPGTGKTRLVKEIAKVLDWPLLSITPSDFLAGGAAEVEQRAKSIFTMLEEQEKMVVLFDEIDHFLLDRESDEYKNQSGIFQFMTPGMLPKLQNLRDKGRILFVIATNYAERIDTAIKRRGRIDRHLLLLPPDEGARKIIIIEALVREINSLSSSDDVQQPEGAQLKIANDTFLENAVKESALMTWGEIVEGCGDLEIGSDDILAEGSTVIFKDEEGLFDKLKQNFIDAPAGISLKAYSSRLKTKDGKIKDNLDQTPWKEYLHLHHIDRDKNGDGKENNDGLYSQLSKKLEEGDIKSPLLENSDFKK